MLIQPWDGRSASHRVAAVVGGPDRFGVLTVDNLDPEHDVPTSCYSAVQFLCPPTVADDQEEKTAILRAQLRFFRPEGGHA